MIAQRERNALLTHVAPTEEMLTAAQNLLGATIPQQFVDHSDFDAFPLDCTQDTIENL